MNVSCFRTPSLWFTAAVLLSLSSGAFADVPLASREADRRAKSAVPGAGDALIYVFRQQDKNTAPLAIKLGARDTARLAPRTFAFWRVKPGRVELTVERSKSALTFAAAGGRVYYVELARAASGVPTLRSVSFPTGRAAIQRAQLVAQSGAPSSKPQPAPAVPTRSVPPASPPPPRRPSNFALALKLGSFKLADDSTVLEGNTRVFDPSASSVFGIEGEWFVWPDIALGVEIVRYATDFATPALANGAGEADTTAVVFNIKRYFLPDSAWQPFIGAGVGGASADFSGALVGSIGGPAVQLTGGVQWRRGNFALRGEYKYLSAKTETDAGQEADMSGSGVFIGAGVHF